MTQILQFLDVISSDRAAFLVIEDEEESFDIVLTDLDLFPHFCQQTHDQIFKLLVVKL